MSTDPKPLIPDILASRYASVAMCRLWSPEGRIVAERELWIAVMKGQRGLGLEIPAEAVAAYERVKERVDLGSIAARERVLRHDVKARIEEFCALAGHEYIHLGLTSRDLTENVEQLAVRRSMELLRDKGLAALSGLAGLAGRHRERVLVARTHNVAAQATTLGRRLAMFGETLLLGWERLLALLESYPLRGLKGAVGTRLDLASLLGGQEQAAKLEASIAAELGFSRVLENSGQVYPRGLDFEVLSILYGMCAGIADCALNIRLMAGQGLLSEGFGKQQVGSSAMPHKMNARSSERIQGFQVLLGGYLEMSSRLAGSQWNEGDVSCSVVRRVALPSAMFAADGMLETFLTVLGELEVYEAPMADEVERTLPFLATTTLLMEAVKKGGGREAMHEIIRGHAVTAAREMRQGGGRENDLARRLGADGDFPLTKEDIQQLLADKKRFIGAAPEQVDAFTAKVTMLAKRFPQATAYTPEPIL